MNADDEPKYMEWWVQHGHIDDPAIEYDAWCAAVAAEREACEWHIENAMKFYQERIEWCKHHPGNDTARITAQYALDSHAGILAAIRARK